MRQRYNPVFLGVFLICSMGGCLNDQLCSGEGSNRIKLSFYQYGAETETALNILIDSLVVSGNPSSGYPVVVDSTFSQIDLEVDPDTAFTQFIFISEDRTDTLALNYTITGRLISVDCGAELLFSRLDTAYQTFDSLVIVNDLLSRETESNIKIYR